MRTDIPSATNIPVDEVTARVAEIDRLVGGNKAAAVVVYCASGARAADATQQLEAAGYTHVVNGGAASTTCAECWVSVAGAAASVRLRQRAAIECLPREHVVRRVVVLGETRAGGAARCRA